MDSEASNQAKNERSRTRWTASLDKIFADLVVKHIQQGNRRNNIFDKKTWNHIRDEFNKQTDLNFNNNQLRKHLDVLRTRFYNLKSTHHNQSTNGFTLDDNCCVGFDLWDDIGAQPRPETIKAKDCPIYEQLCTIFIDVSADGKYAQSSHYTELDKSGGTNNGSRIQAPRSENPPPQKPLSQTAMSSAERMGKIISEGKRKRSSEAESSMTGQTSLDQETCDSMANAMFEMIAASKVGTDALAPRDEKFSITNCIRALDEIRGVDDYMYYAVLDLFEDPKARETFISLTSESEQIRLTWLQEKCGRINF